MSVTSLSPSFRKQCGILLFCLMQGVHSYGNKWKVTEENMDGKTEGTFVEFGKI